ncbi:MAG TPA: hypothetical protein VHA73_13990 [Acidimicrobiales bacterium]|jgi:hypothetical protein|nr:hypothetical protein [Acidimicrobiales bacterium]
MTDERSRHQLYVTLEEHLGEHQADTLMELLPPVGWADVATKHDLHALEERIDHRFDAVDHRFDAMEKRFDLRFAAMDERFDLRFAAMDERFDLRLETVATKDDLAALQRSMITTMIALFGTFAAVILTVVTLIH